MLQRLELFMLVLSFWNKMRINYKLDQSANMYI